MEYPQTFEFSDLQLQSSHTQQHPQCLEQLETLFPAESDPGQGLDHLAAKLGISLDDFLNQWAQINASGDNPFRFLTENLDFSTNGSFLESAPGFNDEGDLFAVGHATLEQQPSLNQDLGISPQVLSVNPAQGALLDNHVASDGVTPRAEHVLAPKVTFLEQRSQHAFGYPSMQVNVPDQPTHTTGGTISAKTRIDPLAISQKAPIPIMYPALDPQLLGQLLPGYYHLLSQDPVPTPENILEGSFTATMRMIDEGIITRAQLRDVVLIVPRPPEFFGKPSMPTIVFADLNRHGRPGPYVRDILNGNARLHGATDWVFEHNIWKTTPFRVNWPGCTITSEYLSCTNKSGQPLNRTELAHLVANKIVVLFQQATSGKLTQTINSNTSIWDLCRINPMKVRVIGVSYYRKFWVPILATNARGDIWDDAVGPLPAVVHPDRIFSSMPPPRPRPGMGYGFRP